MEDEDLVLILEDMTDWVETHVLKDEDFYEHLDKVQEQLGKAAREDRLKFLTEKYWSEHIVY